MNKNFLRIKNIVIIALFAAMLTGGKLALMAIPNVEIVTILIILYAYSFGGKIALPATMVFCIIEGVLFGMNTWLISYFIYWPLLAILSALLAKASITKPIFYIILGTVMTAFFGVITSTVDAIVSSSIAHINFFVLFAAIYARGILFYITHVVSNLIFITIAFPVLSPLFLRAKHLYYKDFSTL